MGRVYAASGPWLDADPFLFTASGPPAPAAWLTDLALHGVARLGGIQGLRVAHVVLVAAILATAWLLLRRASGSSPLASLGMQIFAILAAYRLFQLRPHLLTILASLVLAALLFADARPLSRWRIAAVVVLFAMWANLHGGFVLGLGLLAAAVLGLALAALLRPARRTQDLARARRLALALGLASIATLANPAGAEPHGLYFAAGSETPALELVADEWTPVRLFQLPLPRVPPSPLAWAAVWGLLLGTPAAVFFRTRARRFPGPSAGEPLDPALLALAAAALLGMLSAVRLLWLGIFPLLVVAGSARALAPGSASPRRWLRWGAAGAAALLTVGFLRIGAWPMISQGIQRTRYAEPYPALKHHAHAVWFLRDAGLEGNVFNDYQHGNFLGSWLSPRLRVFVNGSLNVPPQVMEDRVAILERRGSEPGERFVELLDRYRIDVFFGTGTPTLLPSPRRVVSTTTHLERTPGWIPVFRNAWSGVYLRDDERNRVNLHRVAEFYASEGVPFDPERGFDPERVIRERLDWAAAHGLVPANLARLEAATRGLDPTLRGPAQDRLASLDVLLGLYERAAVLDRSRLRADPGSVSARRRVVWSLLHQGRTAEAREEAERLAAIAAAGDGLSELLVETARRSETLSEDETAGLVALLPVFTLPELSGALAGLREPHARAWPPGDTRAAMERPETSMFTPRGP